MAPHSGGGEMFITTTSSILNGASLHFGQKLLLWSSGLNPQDN